MCVMTPQGKALWNRDVSNDARVVRDRVLQFSPPSVVALEGCCGVSNFAEELRRRVRYRQSLAGRSSKASVAYCVTNEPTTHRPILGPRRGELGT